MAIYHLSAKVIGRSAGRSATAAAAYRAACAITDERTGLVHDFTKKRGVVSREILAPSGAPDWTRDRASLWNRVELAETRKDAQVAREIEVALPRELSPAARLQLVRGFVQDEFVAKGMIADICHHAPDAENPHCHVLLTTRVLEGDAFGKKAREWNSKPTLERWRSAWAEHANAALQKEHSYARIDSRSNAARGLDARPTVHLGPQAAALERDGIRTSAGDMNRRARAHNREIENTKTQAAGLRRELQQAHAERLVATVNPEAWGKYQDEKKHPYPGNSLARELERFVEKVDDRKKLEKDMRAEWEKRHPDLTSDARRHTAAAAAALAVSSPIHLRWWTTPREKRRELARQAETTRPAYEARESAVKKTIEKLETQAAAFRTIIEDVRESGLTGAEAARAARDAEVARLSTIEREAAQERERQAQERQAQITASLEQRARDIQKAVSRGDNTQVAARAYIRESVKELGEVRVVADVKPEVVRAIAFEVAAQERQEPFMLEDPEQVEIANDAIKEAREEREHERELAREREQERDGPELEM